MKVFTKERREHSSKTINDLAKTIFAVGLASNLFKDFSLWLKVVMAVICLALLALAFYLVPKGEKP